MSPFYGPHGTWVVGSGIWTWDSGQRLRAMPLRRCEWRVCGTWADRIEVVHLESPILRFTKLLRQPLPKIHPMDEFMVDESSMFARWRGWLFIPLCESICVGFWRFPEGFRSSHRGTPLGTYGTLKIPHKCSHTTCQSSFHFKVGHQKGLGVNG